MSVCCAVLMCHAPIVVPEIGGERGADCARTTEAMLAVARQVAAHRPDVLVIISPHTPRFADAVGVFGAEGLTGSFARFGAPGVRVETKAAGPAVAALLAASESLGLSARKAEIDALDHGALVPLAFLAPRMPDVPVVVLSLPEPAAVDADRMGRAVRRAAERAGGPWAVVASGDMSHRLSPNAPAGFDPNAHRFDRSFVAHLEARRYPSATRPDPDLRAIAAEDVVDSTHAALAAVSFASAGARVYAYEAPFGVGYCEAMLHTASLSAFAPGAPPVLLEVARDAIHAHLHDAPYVAPVLPAPFAAARPVFVTLRSPEGELRGCIGRTAPVTDSLAEEVASCAVAAASRDPRMPSVTREELDALRIEVSVLADPEPIASAAELDPARYGVVVHDDAGRRGVLLPAIEGVESTAQQLEIVRHKAGIEAHAPVQLERFEVAKVCDAAPLG